MANTSLPDLTERTATADSDLIHVNSGGTDYKQTKKNFTFDLAQYHEFNNTESLTSQCDSLATSGKSPAYYVGKINSYGHQSATGVPFNNSYHIQLSIYSASYIELTVMDVDDGGVFRKIKAGGTWQSSWTMQPTRAEITALNNSLTNWNYYQIGSNSYGALDCRYNPSLKLCFMYWRGNSTVPGSAQYSFNLPSNPVLAPNDNVVVKLRNGDSMEVRTDNTVKVTLTGEYWSGGALMYPTR